MKTVLLKVYISMSVVFLFSCSNPADRFNLDKPFWNAEDYKNAILEIRRQTPAEEKFPTLAGHELSAVFHKLINRDNVTIIASDTTLGLQFRLNELEDLFVEFRDIDDLYGKRDREDKFIYDQELAEILRFSSYLQVHYFRIGNERILKEADTPASVAKSISDNQIILIRNFNNYLDYVNYEQSFGPEALESYTNGIAEGFNLLVETFPSADYSPSVTKATDMLAKAKDQKLKDALAQLIDKLNKR